MPMHNKAGAGMSDCKHKKRSSYMRLDGSHVSCCQDCDADFSERELATLERAEKAEARVEELEVGMSYIKNYLRRFPDNAGAHAVANKIENEPWENTK